jgi:sugar/nucleoside kinase (ribokinase family)
MAGTLMAPLRRLLHLGNLVVDVVLSVPALPERGGDVIAAATLTTAGGGFNVMAAATRQGLPAVYAGAIGSGPFAALARAACQREGIELLLPPKPGADTGLVISVVEAGGERTFLTSPGAEATLTGADLATVRAAPDDAVYLSGYGLAHAGNRAALLGWLPGLGVQMVVFDPGPLVRSVPRAALAAVLARATWLTCNAAEAALLTGAGDPWAAAAALSRRPGPGGVLVRTGPGGCLLGRPGAAPVHIPGVAVVARDTAGAGDAHTGAFLAALARGAGAAEAARHANASAAYSVTRHGPATAPTTSQLARFLARHRKERSG